MLNIQDHLGRTVTLPNPPKRIISLVPAITDTMYHLGLEDKIIGRTRFCIHPKDKVKQAVNIGGTKEIKLDRIHELKPDLIIAEKEENTKEIVETLEQYYPVFVFEVKKIADVYRMIEDVGMLTEFEEESTKLVADIQHAFSMLPNVHGKRAAYVIWQRPYMVVGKDTYIQSLLQEMGFANPFVTYEGRYPVVTEEDFQQAELDYILLATEPYPFREKHLEEFQEMLPNVKPVIVDGEMFWYGARMVEATAYFRETFPEI
ncbi:ABC transporter substrate-binding protein [Ornithinibacillus californiensis]|uniref:ABC transporter substrate-binding protein n=1 Tax=Ornithinibacillus californiensis TaxID=161536 RepID=UPI00064D95C4|nr:helical backbone metal receptor [Ornithinibacillus californiensis]